MLPAAVRETRPAEASLGERSVGGLVMNLATCSGELRANGVGSLVRQSVRWHGLDYWKVNEQTV